MARMRLELTQEQVAKAVGFVPTVYGRIERGDMMPSTPKLKALCVLLGISADVLLGVKPSEDPPTQEPPAPPPGDPPELRRLAMLVRELPPDRFRLFRVALRSISHPDEEE
ncbi:hypothetical protein BO221_20250 [Archangium sp. Cb G35]|nr:hypothetical protein BO221_20250 [Archangium sp. Cb G35]